MKSKVLMLTIFLLTIISLRYIECNINCPRLAFLDFNSDFEHLPRVLPIHLAPHSNTQNHNNDDDENEEIEHFNNTKTVSTTNSTKYIKHVNSLLNTTTDAFVQYTYSYQTAAQNRELNTNIKNFLLKLRTNTLTYNSWHDKDDPNLIIKIIETFFNLTSYIVNDDTKLIELPNEFGENYYLIKIHLKISYKTLFELDEIISMLIRLAVVSYNNFEINCKKRVQLRSFELLNFEKEIADHDHYSHNFTENIDKFIDNMLVSYIKLDYKLHVYRLNGHNINELSNNYKYSIKIDRSNENNVTISTNRTQDAAIQIEKRLDCENGLYSLNLAKYPIKFRQQVIDSLLNNVSKTSYSTNVLICLNKTEEYNYLNERFIIYLNEFTQNEQYIQNIYKLDQYLSLIFSLVSCIAIPLLLTFYLKFKKEKFKHLLSDNYLIYILLLTLFLAHLITIINILLNEFQQNTTVCLLFACLKQYIWLTSIFQMNIYAIDLYFKIVRPFSSYSKKPPYTFYCSYFLIIPLILTILPLILHLNNEMKIYNMYHCFLTGTDYLFVCFFLPICLICFINSILMIVYYKRLKSTARVKSTAKSGNSDAHSRNSQLLNTFIKLCFLLGVSWFIYILVAILNLFIKSKYYKLVLVVPTVQICLQGAFLACVHFMPIIYDNLIKRSKSKNRNEAKNFGSESSKKLLSTNYVTAKTSIPSSVSLLPPNNVKS